MIEKFSFIAPLFCFLTLFSAAQKNLKEAIVVFDNADTARGYIDYKEWFTNPTSVLFTTDKNKPVARYNAKGLNYFEVIGIAAYQRHTVRTSLSSDASSNAYGKDTSGETRTVFLKIVERGDPLSLFSYTDDLKQRLYVLEKNQATPQELLNSVYMLDGQLKEEKQYRSDLAAFATRYTAGDNQIVSQINGTGYYTDDIAGICRQINGGTKRVVKHLNAAPRSKSAFRVFVGGGISLGALKMDGNDRFAGKNSHPFYYPLADIGADLPLNPAVGKFIFRMQLHLTWYKTDAYIFQDYGQYTEEYFFTFKQQNIQVAPQLLYNIYNKKELKWFAGAGAALNFSSYPTNKLYFIRKSSTDADATDNNYVKYLKNAWLNFCLSTGISVSRLELAMVYYPSASITQSMGSGIDNSSLQLRLNFYIKK